MLDRRLFLDAILAMATALPSFAIPEEAVQVPLTDALPDDPLEREPEGEDAAARSVPEIPWYDLVADPIR